jgi:hypothetical protein
MVHLLVLFIVIEEVGKESRSCMHDHPQVVIFTSELPDKSGEKSSCVLPVFKEVILKAGIFSTTIRVHWLLVFQQFASLNNALR